MEDNKLKQIGGIGKGVFEMKEFINSQLKKLNFNMEPVRIFDKNRGWI